MQRTVTSILRSGMTYYMRKVRIELQGGPPVNERREDRTVAKKRAKLGATEKWFARRRGGAKETTRKEHSWRLGGCQEVGQNRAPARGSRGRRTLTKYPTPGPQQGPQSYHPEGWMSQDTQKEPKVITTLLVPYTMGSELKDRVQRAEDEFRAMVGGDRVRVVERGGDVLAHLVCRNDPWAARRTCGDPKCVTCRSRTWLQTQRKQAKKDGTSLPKVLEVRTSNQCRREGCNYSLQCLDCALGGVRAIYWGSREGRPGRGTGPMTRRWRGGSHPTPWCSTP